MPRAPRVVPFATLLCAALAGCHTADVAGPVDASAARGELGLPAEHTPSDWLAVANDHLDPTRPSATQDPTLARDAAWRAVRAMDPPTAEAWVTLGTACYVAGDLSGALDAYEHALASPDLDDAAALRAWTDEVRAELMRR